MATKTDDTKSEPKAEQEPEAKAPKEKKPERTILDVISAETTSRRALVNPLFGVQQGESLLRAAVCEEESGVTESEFMLAYAAEGGAPWRESFKPHRRAHYQSTHTGRWHGGGFVHEFRNPVEGTANTTCIIRHGGTDSDACVEKVKNVRDDQTRWKAIGVSTQATVKASARKNQALGRTRHYVAVICAAHDLTFTNVMVGPYFAPFKGDNGFGLKASTKSIKPQS